VLIPHRTHDDAGFTLVELVIGTLLAAIVGTLMLGSLASGQNSERSLEEISASQEDLRRALVEITRDLRAAEPLWYDRAVTPAADPAKELRLERWEINATTPTYIRWHITGGELVRDVVTVDPVTDTLQTVATTYRLLGVDATLTGFAYTYPTATNPEKDVVLSPVDWGRLTECTNKVLVQLRAASLRGKHPTLVRGEINLRNQTTTPGYC